MPQVREFVEATGIENLGKRLVNSREGKVEFEPPKMNVETLLKCAFFPCCAASASSCSLLVLEWCTSNTSHHISNRIASVTH